MEKQKKSGYCPLFLNNFKIPLFNNKLFNPDRIIGNQF